MPLRFFVDPITNSDDPEIRRAYALCITPPWRDGGHLFVNFPEHLEYMPGTKGIARHHDQRRNAWQITDEGRGASYDVESLTEPGVFLAARASATQDRAQIVLTLTNRTGRTLGSIRPLLCCQYHSLKGFPAARSDNFAHTFVLVNGAFVRVDRLPVPKIGAYARMAQVKGCPDRHNWWAQEMGGFIEKELDAAVTVVTAIDGARKVVVIGTPGKNLLTNSAIPCLHADPYFGDLAPGQSKSATQTVVFTRKALHTLTPLPPLSQAREGVIGK